MKKTILMLMLAAMSSGAMAEWVRIGVTDNMTMYVDPYSIRQNNNLRRVWDLQDLKRRAPNGEMSRRGLMEFDCKEERMRTIHVSMLSGPMASGEVISSIDSPSDWRYIPPETVGASVLEFVCRK